jgi:hypothetical protein
MWSGVFERARRSWDDYGVLRSVIGVGVLVGLPLLDNRARLRSGDGRFVHLILLFAISAGILVPLVNYLARKFATDTLPRFSTARIGVNLPLALLISVALLLMSYGEKLDSVSITTCVAVGVWSLLVASGCSPRKDPQVTASPKG